MEHWRPIVATALFLIFVMGIYAVAVYFLKLDFKWKLVSKTNKYVLLVAGALDVLLIGYVLGVIWQWW